MVVISGGTLMKFLRRLAWVATFIREMTRMAAALPFRGEESKSISLCVSFAWLVQTIPNIISLNIERIRIQLLFFFVDRIVSCSLYNQLFPVSFLIIIMKLAFLQESSLFYPSLICFIDCCICSRFGNYYIPIYIYIYTYEKLSSKLFRKIICQYICDCSRIRG